jgi:MoaA/NifB/PqqE/SkfB family radical SAM enzyme
MHLLQSLEDSPPDVAAFRRAVRERQPYKPLYVKIKLIFGCNLKCQMCNHWRDQREAPLPIERFHTILEELALFGCRKVHFSGGEPLLRPQTVDLVAHAVALGMRASLTTNGTLLEKEQAKALVAAGLREVNISLDAPQRKTHDLVRGVPGAWKQTTRAIGYFCAAAHKGKLSIRVNTVVNRLNYHTLAALPDLVASLGAESLALLPVNDWHGRELALLPPHLAAYYQDIAPRLAERALALGLLSDAPQAYPFGATLPAALQNARYGLYADGWYDEHPCFAPWTHSLIDYNGLVYLCCLTREQIAPAGDLKRQSFHDIWNGALYQAYRQMMHPPALPICRRCDEFLAHNQRLRSLVEAPVSRTSMGR